MTSETRAAEHSRLIVLLSAALFAGGAFAILSYPAHHDLTWFLYVAGEMVDGASLYREIVEVNPPLIIWISGVAEILARAMSGWNLLAYRGLILGAAALSILLSRRQLRSFQQGSDETFIDLFTLLITYLLVASPGFEFGQREHLAIVLVFPFLLMTARQITSLGAMRNEDVLVGVLAGIGFAIKPHFLMAWLVVELYALIRRRRVVATLPHLAVITIFVLYGAAVFLFERDYLRLARLGAIAYTRMSVTNPRALLLLPAALWSIGAILAVALLLPRTPYRELFRVLGAATTGFLIVVLVQAKGWAYHWLPAATITGVILPLLLWSWVSQLARERLKRITTALSFGALVLLTVLTVGKFSDAEAHRQRMQGKAYLLPRMIELIERYAHAGPIAALSTNMQVAFPLVNYTDVKWGMRFNSLWLLPGVYPEYTPGSKIEYHTFAAMPAAERYLFNAVVEDLVRTRPTILIVDTLPPGYVLHGFDYLTYFGRDARFAALMMAYHEVGAIERYRIFVRN
jgi:hypothetical protein